MTVSLNEKCLHIVSVLGVARLLLPSGRDGKFLKFFLIFLNFIKIPSYFCYYCSHFCPLCERTPTNTERPWLQRYWHRHIPHTRMWAGSLDYIMLDTAPSLLLSQLWFSEWTWNLIWFFSNISNNYICVQRQKANLTMACSLNMCIGYLVAVTPGCDYTLGYSTL